MLLSVKNLTVGYGDQIIVENISFDLPRGKILAIVGESGSGKSTVLKAINGLLGRNGRIIDGTITFDGRDITSLDDRQRRQLAGQSIATIFQNASSSFCPIRTVGDQIYEAVRCHTDWSKEMFQARATEIMKKINLREDVLDEYPLRLSGGMAQRAGILAAIILEPKLLLADEPTSALDTVTQVEVVRELLNLRRNFGLSIVIVTHHPGVANFIADKILVVRNGSAAQAA